MALEFRLRRGVTQAAVAKISELHRSCLSVLELGSTTDTVRHLVSVFRAFDLGSAVRPREGAHKDGA